MCKRGPLPIVRLSGKLTITPSTIDLSRGEPHFIAEAGREYILRDCLKKTPLGGDTTVILDCPPSLGVLSIGCLTASKYTCVVVQPGGFELRTLIHLDETVRMLQERVNPGLSVIGAVLTNCHHRRLITKEVCREVSKYWPVLGKVRADARLPGAPFGFDSGPSRKPVASSMLLGGLDDGPAFGTVKSCFPGERIRPGRQRRAAMVGS
jgi:chromosome partitioning protein